MRQSFAEATNLASAADVQAWRSAWMGALGSWHSPYKVLVDCAELKVGDDEKVVKALDLMVKFFNGFFLRKIVGYNRREDHGHERLPFPVLPSEEEGSAEDGIRTRNERVATDFRST